MTTVPLDPALVLGITTLEPTERGLRPHRLPAWVRERFPDPQLLGAEARPSGARVRLTTAATQVALTVHPSRQEYAGAERPRGAIDVLVDGELHTRDPMTGGDVVEIAFGSTDSTERPGPPHTTTVVLPSPAGEGAPVERLVEFWLPHNETVDLVSLTADAPVRPAPPTGRRWLHHGSSISHGSAAAHPTEIWPVVAARRAGVELINLGLGGSAMVDPFLARVIADTPAELISIKLGINVVNGDVMRLRAFVPAVHGFLDTVRDGHPDTPVVLVSPVHCAIHETTPGPLAVDEATLGTGQVRFTATGDPAEVPAGRLTLQVIRRELAAIVEQRADPALRYLDGLSLYGADDEAELPLPDGLHPDTAAHARIGERFADAVFARP